MPYESTIPDLADLIKEYASIKSLREPLEEILIDQANKLACSNFGGDNKGLFQEAAAVAPSKDELLALPIHENWHIKREKGNVFSTREAFTPSRGKNKGETRIRRTHGTQIGEIEKRISHRFYEAAYWLSARLNRYATGSKSGTDKAVVFIQTTGEHLEVVIRNQANKAAEVASRTGYLARAIENREKDLMEYINRHLDQATTNFKKGKF